MNVPNCEFLLFLAFLFIDVVTIARNRLLPSVSLAYEPICAELRRALSDPRLHCRLDSVIVFKLLASHEIVLQRSKHVKTWWGQIGAVQSSPLQQSQLWWRLQCAVANLWVSKVADDVMNRSTTNSNHFNDIAACDSSVTASQFINPLLVCFRRGRWRLIPESGLSIMSLLPPLNSAAHLLTVGKLSAHSP